MIRPTVPEDTAILVKLAEGTNVFKPHEIVALEEVLDDYHATMHTARPSLPSRSRKTAKSSVSPTCAPAAMTDQTWYLYWIAVTKQTQAKGIGTQLLHYSEKEIQKAGGRLYLIETSSLPHYEQTRKFYLKHGYEQHAVIADFYCGRRQHGDFSEASQARLTATRSGARGTPGAPLHARDRLSTASAAKTASPAQIQTKLASSAGFTGSPMTATAHRNCRLGERY